ncbi:MAG: ABC transporter permease subunit [Caldilineaceae bacterium]|nr:ABC transporter permease subunit [Caldilineaceae bacterium]
MIPAAILGFFVLASVLAPFIAPYDPNKLDLANILAEPNWAHPLGTDQLGRDLLSRLLYGGRMTLSLAAVSVVGVIVIGLFFGVIAGYAGGRIDLAISTLLTMLLALPNLLLTLAILGILGPGVESLLIALIGAGWVGHARIFRALILSLREELYIEAGHGIGCSPARIILRHLLPNLIPTVIILATLDLGAFLLIVSSLSFLGLGVQPPHPDWGVMLNDARPYFGQVPFLILGPGICITLVALSSNLLGDAVRDLTDRRP